MSYKGMDTAAVNQIATVWDGDWEKYKKDAGLDANDDSGLFFKESVLDVTDTIITLAYRGDFDRQTGVKIIDGDGMYQNMRITKISS